MKWKVLIRLHRYSIDRLLMCRIDRLKSLLEREILIVYPVLISVVVMLESKESLDKIESYIKVVAIIITILHNKIIIILLLLKILRDSNKKLIHTTYSNKKEVLHHPIFQE